MAKQKIRIHNAGEAKVRITGPGCEYGGRLYQPGETATVPAEVAIEWIQDERAVALTAEVTHGDW